MKSVHAQSQAQMPRPNARTSRCFKGADIEKKPSRMITGKQRKMPDLDRLAVWLFHRLSIKRQQKRLAVGIDDMLHPQLRLVSNKWTGQLDFQGAFGLFGRQLKYVLFMHMGSVERHLFPGCSVLQQSDGFDGRSIIGARPCRSGSKGGHPPQHHSRQFNRPIHHVRHDAAFPTTAATAP